MPGVKKTVKAKEKELIERLTEVEHELANVGLKDYIHYLNSSQKILWTNLLAGIARGLGFVLGATVFVTLFTLFLSYLTGVPIVGEFFEWVKESLGNTNI